MACLFSGRGENAGILAHSRHQTHFVSLLLLDGNVKRGVWGTQGGPASIGASFITPRSPCPAALGGVGCRHCVTAAFGRWHQRPGERLKSRDYGWVKLPAMQMRRRGPKPIPIKRSIAMICWAAVWSVPSFICLPQNCIDYTLTNAETLPT